MLSLNLRKARRAMRRLQNISRHVLYMMLFVMLLLPATASTVSAGTKNMTVAVTKESKQYKKTVKAGDKLTIKIRANGKTVVPLKAKFKSSNKAVAAITGKGVIKAKKPGGGNDHD